MTYRTLVPILFFFCVAMSAQVKAYDVSAPEDAVLNESEYTEKTFPLKLEKCSCSSKKKKKHHKS